MSKGPALLSRRSLLRGAASLTVLAAFAAVASCADGAARSADGDVDAPAPGPDPAALLRLGHAVAEDPTGAPPPTGTEPSAGTIADDATAVGMIDARAEAVRADFAAGQTRGAAGWLLAATEAQVLASYAGACPLPAC